MAVFISARARMDLPNSTADDGNDMAGAAPSPPQQQPPNATVEMSMLEGAIRSMVETWRYQVSITLYYRCMDVRTRYNTSTMFGNGLALGRESHDSLLTQSSTKGKKGGCCHHQLTLLLPTYIAN